MKFSLTIFMVTYTVVLARRGNWEAIFWTWVLIGVTLTIYYTISEGFYWLVSKLPARSESSEVHYHQHVHQHQEFHPDPTRPRDEHDGWPAIIEAHRRKGIERG